MLYKILKGATGGKKIIIFYSPILYYTITQLIDPRKKKLQQVLECLLSAESVCAGKQQQCSKLGICCRVRT